MWPEVLIIILMIALNSVFAAYEMALASVSLARLQRLKSEGARGVRPALHMKRRMEASLTTVQIGITLVGAIAAAVGGASAEEEIAPLLQSAFAVSPRVVDILAIAIVVIPLTAITIFFGELVPKVFALRNNEWICLRLSPVMLAFSLSVWPVVRLSELSLKAVIRAADTVRNWRKAGKTVTEAPELQEIRAMATLARSLRLIGRREESIILSTLALSGKVVRDAMLPIEEAAILNVTDSMTDCLIKAHLDMHTRFPVVENPQDRTSVIGYANFKDIVSQLRMCPKDPSLRAIVRPLPSMPAKLPLAGALDSLMKSHVHIALVRDRDDRVIGIVTLEDIIEELVGDIRDEYDRLPSRIASSGAGWVIGGGTPIAQIKEETGIDLAVDPPPPTPEKTAAAHTLTEWCEGHLGRGIQGGDIVERPVARVAVRKLRRLHVFEALVTPANGPIVPVSADRHR